MTCDDGTIRIDRDEFLSAPPEIAPRVAQIIEEIRANRCFAEKCVPYDPKYAQRSYEKGRGAKAGGGGVKAKRHHAHGHMHGHAHHTGAGAHACSFEPRRPPTVLGGDLPRDKRCITDNINKLTLSNYATIAQRMQFVIDDKNLVYGVSEILDKAYEQFNRCNLYVNLILDIYEGLGATQQAVMKDLLREKMSESLDEADGFPHVDPVQDYDGFCRVVKSKTRAVGRCGTFSKMLQKVQSFFKHSPEDYYDHHERQVLKYVKSGAADDAVDVASSVENLLDRIEVIIKHYAAMRNKFRLVLSEIGPKDLPSNKCRFKVLDIIGK